MASTLNQVVRSRSKVAWRRMLLRPGSTMASVLTTSRGHQGFGIGALMGMAQLANSPPLYVGGAVSAGSALSWILIVGPVVGWCLLWIGGWLLWQLGRVLFRGTGSPRELRLALGWGSIPLIWSLLFWIPLILFLWGDPVFFAVSRPVSAVAFLWTVWTLSVAVATAHQIRFSGALACVILTVSALSLPLMLVF